MERTTRLMVKENGDEWFRRSVTKFTLASINKIEGIKRFPKSRFFLIS